MTKAALDQVVRQAIGDAAFRRQLQSDPDSALAGFQLTGDERSAITSGDPARLSALGIDQRMSKAFDLGGHGGTAVSKTISPEAAGLTSRAIIDEAPGASGAAFDPGYVGGASAAREAGTGGALDLGMVDAGHVSGGETKFEQADSSLDLGMIDPGQVSGDAAARADVTNTPDTTDAQGNTITE